MNLEIVEQLIQTYGPARVLINEDGEAVPMKKARELGISPDIIFIRDDGWSLGATEALREVAYRMWEDSWVAFWRRGNKTSTRIGNGNSN